MGHDGLNGAAVVVAGSAVAGECEGGVRDGTEQCSESTERPFVFVEECTARRFGVVVSQVHLGGSVRDGVAPKLPFRLARGPYSR